MIQSCLNQDDTLYFKILKKIPTKQHYPFLPQKIKICKEEMSQIIK